MKRIVVMPFAWVSVIFRDRMQYKILDYLTHDNIFFCYIQTYTNRCLGNIVFNNIDTLLPSCYSNHVYKFVNNHKYIAMKQGIAMCSLL